MPTPSLRILIADDQLAQRLNIEKMLNQQGYHRIAPVTSFAELLAMVEGAILPFDLLVINSALGVTATFDLDVFFLNCPAIHHTLVYDGVLRDDQVTVSVQGTRVIKKLLRTPDEQAIRDLMRAIDPQAVHPARRNIWRKLT